MGIKLHLLFILLVVLLTSCLNKNNDNNITFGNNSIGANIVDASTVNIDTNIVDDKIYADEIHENSDIYHHLNSLYEAHEGYTVGCDEDKWFHGIAVVEDELLSFFNTSDSMIDDLTTKLPFLNFVVSADGLIRSYTWSRKMYAGSADEYGSVIQIFDSDNNPKAVLDINSRNNEIFIVGENIYLLWGKQYIGHGFTSTGMRTISTIDNTIVPYNAFNNRDVLGFQLYELSSLFLSNLAYNDWKIAFDLNVTKIPYSMTFTYAKKIDRKEYEGAGDSSFTLGDSSVIIKLDDLRLDSLTFIWDGEKFVGDYERLEKMSPR